MTEITKEKGLKRKKTLSAFNCHIAFCRSKIKSLYLEEAPDERPLFVIIKRPYKVEESFTKSIDCPIVNGMSFLLA